MSAPYLVRCCRFCTAHAHRDRLVKYGTRAYAHFECFAANKTLADVEALPQYERRRFESWRNEQPAEAPRPNRIWP